MYKAFSTIVLTTLILSACGGGSGKSDETENNTPISESTETLSITTSSVISSEENNNINIIIETTSNNPEADITLSISGGEDRTLFSISDNNLISNVNFDFENPQDANSDNNYELQISATTNGGTTTSRSISIEILDSKELDFQTPKELTVEENTEVSQPISITFEGVELTEVQLAITGGFDASNFTFEDSNNNLISRNSFDFENPQDHNNDNVYEVELTALNGDGIIGRQLFNITVTNKFVLSHELIFPTQNSNIAINASLEDLRTSGKTAFEAVARLIDLEDGEVTSDELESINSFTINGIDLSRNSQYPNLWSASIPVASGPNDFRSEFIGATDNVESQTVTAFNNIIFTNPQFLAINDNNTKAYFSAADSTLESTLIFEFDIDKEVYLLLSSDLTTEGVALDTTPRSIASSNNDSAVIDQENHRLLYLDVINPNSRIISIDLSTGFRSEIPTSFPPTTRNTNLRIIGFNPTENLLYFSDGSRYFTFNMTNNSTSVIGSSSGNFSIVDIRNNRILETTSTSLTSYDINTGRRNTILFYPLQRTINFTPTRITLTSENDIVLSDPTNAVVFNIESSNVETIASSRQNLTIQGTHFFCEATNSLYFINARNNISRLTEVDGQFQNLYRNEGGLGDFSLSSGVQTLQAEILLDFSNSRAHIPQLNNNRGSFNLRVDNVDLTNGDKELIFNQVLDSNVTYSGVSNALAFDDTKENIYFIDSIIENIYRLNLATFEISFVSRLSQQFDNSSTLSSFNKIIKIEGEDSLIFSTPGNPTPGIYKIEIQTGNVLPISTLARFRTSNTNDLNAGSGIGFDFPSDIILNPNDNNQLFVLDFDRIISVSLNNGNRITLGEEFSNELIASDVLDFVLTKNSEFVILSDEPVSTTASIINQYNPSNNTFRRGFNSPIQSTFTSSRSSRLSPEGFYLDVDRQLYYFYRDFAFYQRGILAYSPISNTYISLSL